MRLAVVAGARPNFMKIAPVLRAVLAAGLDAPLVHTGQHYDERMSDRFFADLDIPRPEVNLGVGSGTSTQQTARAMLRFEEWLVAGACDAVLVVGDVNSTLACALVAVRQQLPVAHVEAGLRSGDRAMPEEINRILTDALASWLFTPSPDADTHLAREGIGADRIFRVGNVMVDCLLANLERAMASDVAQRLRLPAVYGLVTLHRPSLVDHPDRLGPVLGALERIARTLPLLFPVHPRTRASIGLLGGGPRGVRLIEPEGYHTFLRLQAGARLVLTDSGGVQEETTVLGIPCLTLRDNTERPITLTEGTNRLVGLDPARIERAAAAALDDQPRPCRPQLWDGRASERIAAVLAGGTLPEPSVHGVPAPAARGSP